VTAFGPFYHLVLEDERRQVAAEMRRVLAPHGKTLIAFIPRLSGAIGLIDRASTAPAQVPTTRYRRSWKNSSSRRASAWTTCCH